MLVLVTGHLGYIGSVLTKALRQRGHAVVGLDSDLYRNCDFGSSPPKAATIFKDVRDVEPEDLNGFDAVLHLAGLSNDPLGEMNPELTLQINYRASVRLAALAKQAGVSRFIFSSTCSVYGGGGDDLLTEKSSTNPLTAYAESKLKAEKEIAMLAGKDFSPTFLRNATACGMSPRIRFDLVLNNLIAWAHSTGKVHLKSDGQPWRPIVHVEDIARAFIAVLEAPRQRVHNEIFNVVKTDENYRISQLAEIVSKVVPDSEISFAETASPDARCYRVSSEKIYGSLPQFKPHWTAHKSAVQLYRAFKKHGVTVEEFEGEKYKRIAQIKMLIREGLLDSTLRFKKQKAKLTPRTKVKQNSETRR